MNRSKLLIAIAFSLMLTGCGGGGSGDGADNNTAANPGGTNVDQDQQPDDTDTSPPAGDNEPVDEAIPDIELATVPELQGSEEMIPPGVPRLN